MNREELRSRVSSLLGDGNYIGAYGLLDGLPKGDPDRVDLTGRVANAIARELDAARNASADRQAWLRSQLAWVCRDVDGLSWLYREQLRTKDRAAQDDLLGALKDLASGRPEDAADRLRRGLEGAGESLKSGEAADRVQGFLREAEQGLRDGLRSVGLFFETMRRRGEALRSESAEGGGAEAPGGRSDDGEWTPPGKKAPGSTGGDGGFKVDITDE